MENPVSVELVEQWLKAWSLSRKLPLPVKYRSGLMVDVGFEKQKTRYVFTEVNNDFIELANSIDEPWVFLKVCSSPKQIESILPGKWVIQPQGFMMHCFRPMIIPNAILPKEYQLKLSTYNSTFLVEIFTHQGELASAGRVVLIDDLAVYDRIVTDDLHRRKGLATFLMQELEKIALSKGVFRNFLVATIEGKRLYQSLGWELYCHYTSIVISL